MLDDAEKEAGPSVIDSSLCMRATTPNDLPHSHFDFCHNASLKVCLHFWHQLGGHMDDAVQRSLTSVSCMNSNYRFSTYLILLLLNMLNNNLFYLVPLTFSNGFFDAYVYILNVPYNVCISTRFRVFNLANISPSISNHHMKDCEDMSAKHCTALLSM